MPFVVDTSVAACCRLPDEGHPTADIAFLRIADDHAVVPALRWFELRNLLVVNERRGRLDSTKTAQALRLLRALPITVDDDIEENGLLRLAREHRLYDAAYLELAQREALPLATLDTALIKAARAERVVLLGPAAPAV